MKWLIITVTFFGVTSLSAIESKNTGDGDRYFLFPDSNNQSLHVVDVEEPIDKLFIEEYARDPANNEYWLYTRTNPTIKQVLIPNEVESIANTSINFDKVIVFLVHGWKGQGDNDMNRLLTKAFLQNDDVNVIVFDWSGLANRNYVTAKRGVPTVGYALGEFINWIVNIMGASYDKIHLVGFSLGAHLVGCAGREAKGLVKRITGLDPAGLLWKNDENRLQNTDARYVEVIHTNAGFYGFSDRCGHADFYPNGGSGMPGCWLNACSHSRAYEYLAASLMYTKRFVARECEDMNDMKRNNCDGVPYYMGNVNLSKPTRSGIFRVNTGSDFPFFPPIYN
ncbi:lipase domain-containing protein [Phthorimaea operculella]|nr:lipase domain-containing protein [Phthorimaea operculella]